ncbi:glycine cleavage system protein H [Rubripirellula lacrimiformis]|nr:glycine cleavage system protein H [Rubripirellula lacrimiformis]
MGEFTATFPRDRRYATNHMWAAEVSPKRFRFGLTAYAVRLLQDVYFLDWIVEAPTTIAARSQIGSIESKKAESDLYAPVPGQLTLINDAVLADPSLINSDPYGDGWMVEMEASDDSPLLDPDGYAQHLIKAWDVAQKTIKGQANT